MTQTRISTAVLALVSLLAFGVIGFRLLRPGVGDAGNSQVKTAWDGIIREVPEKILVYPWERRMEMVMRPVEPTRWQEATGKLPGWAEVYTVINDGRVLPGLYYGNYSDERASRLSSPEPTARAIDLKPDGVFTSELGRHTRRFTREPGMKPHSFDPWFVVQEPIQDTNYVSIRYDPNHALDLRGKDEATGETQKRWQRVPGTSLDTRADFGYVFEDVPAEIADALAPAVGRSQNLINGLLTAASPSLLVKIKWEDFTNNGIPNDDTDIAGTSAPMTQRPYQTVRQRFIENETQSSSGELDLLDALRLGTTINCETNTGVVFYNQVELMDGIISQWPTESIQPLPHTIFINSNRFADFDFDSTNGIDPQKRDIECSIIHETLHVLSFQSNVDAVPNGSLPPTSLDLFRLSGLENRSVSFQTMNTKPRWFKPSPAFTVTALMSPFRTYNMSAGAILGFDADHWLDDTIQGYLIGIMDPELLAGQLYPGYLSPADIHAIDLVGWDIDPNDVPAPPNMPGLIEPADGLPDVPRLITLSMQPTTSSTSVFVFRQSPWPSEADMVFAAREISGGSVTIPYGVLHGSTTYTWFATALAPHGFTISEQRTFTTGCTADFDLTGFVDTDDVGAFVQAYELGDISADVDATGFDLTGFVDTDDLDFFMQAYANGC